MYLVPLNYAFEMVKMVSFVLWIFNNKKFNSIQFVKEREEEGRRNTQQRKPCEGRGQSGLLASQGTPGLPAPARGWEKDDGLSLRAPDGTSPADTLSVDFRPPEL